MLVSVLIAGGAAVETYSQNAIAVTTDIEAVNQVWTEYAKAVSTGDYEAWESLWTKDAVKMEERTAAKIGLDSFRRSTQAKLASNDVRMVIRVEKTVIAGAFAYTRGSFDEWTRKKMAGIGCNFQYG